MACASGVWNRQVVGVVPVIVQPPSWTSQWWESHKLIRFAAPLGSHLPEASAEAH